MHKRLISPLMDPLLISDRFILINQFYKPSPSYMCVCFICPKDTQCLESTVGRLWVMLCWKTWCPANHAGMPLTHTAYISIFADDVHLFVKTLNPGVFALLAGQSAQHQKQNQAWVLGNLK